MSIDEASRSMPDRPRRQRTESGRVGAGSGSGDRGGLGLPEVLTLLGQYPDGEEATGGINCGVCGKLYRSKVCLTKHLWEHSIYWDVFEGEKNQERVLSIQAALILFSGPSDRLGVTSLLVTSPHDKKLKGSSEGTQLPVERACKRRLRLEATPPKRRHRANSGSDSGVGSASDSEAQGTPMP